MRQILIAAALVIASPVAAQDFAAGQTFACEGPQAAVAVIGRVDTESFEGATVISVSLFSLAPDAPVPEAGHIPLEAAAFAASCPTPAPARPLGEDFEAGYRMWREAVAAERGGYFTIPVSEVLDVIAGNLPPREDIQ